MIHYRQGLTGQQMSNLFVMQLETNELYQSTWRDVPAWQYHAAATKEMVEMMDEVEVNWKFYGSNKTQEFEKALFELVDTVHFLLTYVMLTDWPTQSRSVETALFHQPKTDHWDDMFGDGFDDMVADHTMTIADAFPAMLDCFHKMTATSTTSTKIELISRVIYFGSKALGYTITDYLDAHKLKNDRNRIRAAGGAIEGTYDKSQETELKL